MLLDISARHTEIELGVFARWQIPRDYDGLSMASDSTLPTLTLMLKVSSLIRTISCERILIFFFLNKFSSSQMGCPKRICSTSRRRYRLSYPSFFPQRRSRSRISSRHYRSHGRRTRLELEAKE